MKHRRHFLAALCLLVCLCLPPLLLAGCATKETLPSPAQSVAAAGDSAGAATENVGVSLAEAMAAMNRPVAEPLARQLSTVSWSGLVDGRITLCGRGQVNAATGQAPYLLVTLDAETEDFTCRTLTLPAPSADRPGLLAAWNAPADAVHGEEYDSARRSLAGVVATEQGLLVLLDDTLLHTSPEQEIDQVTERDLTLCRLAEDGTLQPLARLQLPEGLAADAAVDNLFLGQDGTLWLTACDYAVPSAALLGFSMADGSLQKSLPLPEGATPGNVALLPDGRLALGISRYAGPQQGMTCSFLVAEGLESAAPRWQQQPLTPPAPLDALSTLPAFVPQLDGDDETVLVNTGDALVRWDLVAGRAEEVLRWMQLSVDASKLSCVFGLADDRYLACIYDHLADPEGCYQLRMLTPLDPAALAGRTVLTMAITPYYWGQNDPAVQVINAFNASSSEYYIQTVDWQARYLGSEILGEGDLPDIIMVATVESSLLNKGVFIDLYPLLDADPDLSREDFLPNILAATEANGRLSTIAPAYELQGLAAATADVGEDPGWTLEEMYRLCEQNPTPFLEMGKTWLLRYIVQNSGTAFVDWEAGQAHFDTPEYARLLEFCATQPDILFPHAYIDEEDKLDINDPLKDGKPLLLDLDLNRWGDVNTPRFIFDGAYTLVGYPTPNGETNGFVIDPALQLAITYTCQDPEAAWQLVRTFLLPAFQDHVGVEMEYPGFPLRQDSLLAGAAKAQTQNNFGGRSYFSDSDAWSDAQEYIQRPLAQEDTDKIVEAVEGAAALWNTDITFFAILEEEAQDFYNGVRTAEEAAAITQQRMQLYLDEQG